MAIIFNATSKRIVAPPRSERIVDITIVEEPIYTGGSSTPMVNNDREYNYITGAKTLKNFTVLAQGIPDNSIMLTSSNDTYGVVDGSGVTVIDQGLTGDINVFVDKVGYAQRKIRRLYSTANTDATDSTGYVAGTLGAHILAGINTLISGQTASNAIQQSFTSNNYDMNSPAVVRNPNLFTGALDFAGVSVMDSRSVDDRYPLTLVTNRHAIIATHVGTQVGDYFVFMRTDGTYQKVQVLTITNVVGDGVGNDTSVAYLDTVVTGVPFFKTMPIGWMNTYTPSSVALNDSPPQQGIIPVIRKSMHSSVGAWGPYLVINTISNITVNGANYKADIGRRGPNHTGEIPNVWGEKRVIQGDSGSPSFLLINGELVLISTQWAVEGTMMISEYETEINAIMTTQAGSSYSLTNISLAGFTTY